MFVDYKVLAGATNAGEISTKCSPPCAKCTSQADSDGIGKQGMAERVSQIPEIFLGSVAAWSGCRTGRAQLDGLVIAGFASTLHNRSQRRPRPDALGMFVRTKAEFVLRIRGGRPFLSRGGRYSTDFSQGNSGRLSKAWTKP
jgi:hypothetical protein